MDFFNGNIDRPIVCRTRFKDSDFNYACSLELYCDFNKLPYRIFVHDMTMRIYDESLSHIPLSDYDQLGPNYYKSFDDIVSMAKKGLLRSDIIDWLIAREL